MEDSVITIDIEDLLKELFARNPLAAAQWDTLVLTKKNEVLIARLAELNGKVEEPDKSTKEA